MTAEAAWAARLLALTPEQRLDLMEELLALAAESDALARVHADRQRRADELWSAGEPG